MGKARKEMKQKTLFLDFDETLSDFNELGSQYIHALTAHMAQRFGGENDAWKTSVTDTLEYLLTDYDTRFTRKPLAGFNQWMEAARLTFVESLCQSQSLTLPADPKAFAREIQSHTLAKCNAAFPGAQNALESLSQAGVSL